MFKLILFNIFHYYSVLFVNNLPVDFQSLTHQPKHWFCTLETAITLVDLIFS